MTAKDGQLPGSSGVSKPTPLATGDVAVRRPQEGVGNEEASLVIPQNAEIPVRYLLMFCLLFSICNKGLILYKLHNFHIKMRIKIRNRNRLTKDLLVLVETSHFNFLNIFLILRIIGINFE